VIALALALVLMCALAVVCGLLADHTEIGAGLAGFVKGRPLEESAP
jgi:hypothetical protein